MGLLKDLADFASERKRRLAFQKNAEAMAAEAYSKDLAGRQLQSSDLTMPILIDLAKAAKLSGSVTVKMADGTEIKFEHHEDREQIRKRLNQMDETGRVMGPAY